MENIYWFVSCLTFLEFDFNLSDNIVTWILLIEHRVFWKSALWDFVSEMKK
jgi:hypothetical protein